MSIRISLTDQPEFFTNLDVINGRVVLSLNRAEQVGAIIVKLEGESRTALALPSDNDDSPGGSHRPRPPAGAYPGGGNIMHENHKILYKVAQVFPDESIPAMAVPVSLQPGQYEFPFRFKLPFNNVCSDPAAMVKIGGLAGAGGYATGPGLFGLGGIRVMDGSKQLMYEHVKQTLPPSFTGFPRQAEIRYFIKVTIQRPGLFKENWRYQIGFKFLPIEPPRPQGSTQMAYARRPFTFQPKTPPIQQERKKKGSSIFSNLGQPSHSSFGSIPTTPTEPIDPKAPRAGVPPSIQMSALLPHPSILTCNKPLGLRLLAEKLAPSCEQVYLVSLQIDLIGLTHVRCQDLANTETTRWVVVSHPHLRIPLLDPSDPVGKAQPLPEALWDGKPLPNTVMPTFQTCNLSREYQLELKLGLSWGAPAKTGKGKTPVTHPQALFLPLLFSSVQVYSGMEPPPALLRAMSTRPANTKPKPRPARKPSRPSVGSSAAAAAAAGSSASAENAPPLPPRMSGDVAPPQYEEAPPSYDEAMAEGVPGPLIPPGQARPAYSGVTNENAPLTIPEKG